MFNSSLSLSPKIRSLSSSSFWNRAIVEKLSACQCFHVCICCLDSSHLTGTLYFQHQVQPDITKSFVQLWLDNIVDIPDRLHVGLKSSTVVWINSCCIYSIFFPLKILSLLFTDTKHFGGAISKMSKLTFRHRLYLHTLYLHNRINKWKSSVNKKKGVE